MTAMQFLMEWTFRSSILILCGALLLRVLRVHDASIRLAAWIAMLCGSLAIPALTLAPPAMTLAFPRVREPATDAPAVVFEPPSAPVPSAFSQPSQAGVGVSAASLAAKPEPPIAKPFDWARVAARIYALIAAVLLLRICAGIVIGRRLLRESLATELAGIRESDRVGSPVTLGIMSPVIILPGDWRKWDSVKLEAVLAHERSHIRRFDPAVQLLSAMHRALLWASPLSWFLHRQIVRAAEEVSDDAAVAATQDRAAYAEALLDFMQRGIWSVHLAGVPMARYDSPELRIRRILNGTRLSRGVTRWGVTAIAALASPLAYVVATAQPQNPPRAQAPAAQAAPAAPASPPQASASSRSAARRPAFDTAEISVSAPNTILRTRSGFSHGKYEIKTATLADLIGTAWGIDEADVVGGPEWLDTERFDVTATAPNGATEETLKSMLQALLEDRFRLVVRPETRSLLAYAMTAGKKPSFRGSAPSAEEESGCTVQAGTLREPVVYQCRKMTMAGFAKDLATRWPGPDYLLKYKVIDRTGLKGAWDFSFECSRPAAGPSLAPPATTLFAALEEQVGLKLDLAKVATQVVVVESTVRPELTKSEARRLQFEVATIRPDSPGIVKSNVGIQPGGRVTIEMTLKGLIWEAWGNVNPDRIIGVPKSTDETGWVVVAKAPTDDGPVSGWNGLDLDSMRRMLRAFLMDRFKLQAHEEDRLMDGYALVAVKAKLKKADPANRPGCKEGPGTESRNPNWKDPRITNPLASRLVTCQNVTLGQLAARMSTFTTDGNSILGVFPPVADATGIGGSYDLTINFSPDRIGRSQNGPGDGVASEPDGTISIFEALDKQLGLKLESRKVTAKVLVVDHVEENPTEN